MSGARAAFVRSSRNELKRNKESSRGERRTNATDDAPLCCPAERSTRDRSRASNWQHCCTLGAGCVNLPPTQWRVHATYEESFRGTLQSLNTYSFAILGRTLDRAYSSFWGLPDMISASQGGGVHGKGNMVREIVKINSKCRRGGGGQKSKNFVDIISGSPCPCKYLCPSLRPSERRRPACVRRRRARKVCSPLFLPSFPSSRGLFDSLGTERLSIQIEERPGKEGREEGDGILSPSGCLKPAPYLST